MRKLIMKMSLSIDGFVCGTNGEADWIFRSSDEQSRAWLLEKTREAGLIIAGRKTFEVWTSFWPTAPGPLAAAMNEIPKALFTKKGFRGTDASASTESSSVQDSWTEAKVFHGDLAHGIAELKSAPGKPILAFGGGGFMRSLIASGLIDEYHLVIHPVVLGGGMPIFNGIEKPLDLKLVDVKTFPGGIAIHTYRPA